MEKLARYVRRARHVHVLRRGCESAAPVRENAECADACRRSETSAGSRRTPRQNRLDRNQPRSSPSSSFTITLSVTHVRLQSFKQAVRETRRIENRAQQ